MATRPGCVRLARCAPDGFTVYVANLRSYHKTGEIAANPKVELCYLDPDHNQVRITGVAEIVTDRPCSMRSGRAILFCAPISARRTIPRSSSIALCLHQVRYMREWALEYLKCPSK